MTMDGDSSDRSPPLSDHTTGSWIPFWDGEDSSTSVSVSMIDASSEIYHIVEDKEIASKAVAFVVNNTRKGIVPLCADVARLMRAKLSLDRKVSTLRTENSFLRSSIASSVRLSHPDSPIPGSIASGSSELSHDIGPHGEHKCSPTCSQCSSSQGSSIDSTSPKIGKIPHPRLHRTSAFSVPKHRDSHRHDDHSHITVATVHPAPPSGKSRHRRKNSLPEMISEPQSTVQKVSPRANRASVGVQCTLLSPSGEYGEEHGIPPKTETSDELLAMRKEIESLRKQLREYEMKDLASHQIADNFHVENEYAHDDQSQASNPSHHDDNTQQPMQSTVEPPQTVVMATTANGPIRIEPPLEGCKCGTCEKSAGSVRKRESISVSTGDRAISLTVGDPVALAGQRTGRVMYVGHLDDRAEPHVVHAGVQLDTPVGHHDGMLHGKRYFSCEHNCGVFVPVQEVICVVDPTDPKADHPLSAQHLPDTRPRPHLLPLTTKPVPTTKHHKSHRHGKEKRYLSRTTSKLKLPRDPILSSSDLV